jgi:uncharacterized protein YbjT (DUF2867 family)
MFVVVGATGNTGSVVVETLLNRKQPVRVIVRSADKGAGWKAKGAEVAASVGGHIDGRTGPIRAASYGEHALEAAAKNITILRPSYFMDNWAPVLGAAKAEGVLPTFIAPQAKIPMTSTKDIGRIGAEHLMAGGRGKQIVEIAGPEDYSPNQVALALGQILGKTVTAQQAPLSAVVPTFKTFGFSDEAARLFEEMYAGFSSGTINYEHPASVIRGQVTLAEALQRLAKAG